MFFFGDVEAQADTYIQSALADSKRKVRDCHYEEMTQKEARVALVHLRMALKDAMRDGAPEEVEEELLARYEELLIYMLGFDRDIQRALETGAYRPHRRGPHLGRIRAAFTEITGRVIPD